MTVSRSALTLCNMTQSREPLPGQWARLNADQSCGLRRGAWYRVVRLTPDEAVLSHHLFDAALRSHAEQRAIELT